MIQPDHQFSGVPTGVGFDNFFQFGSFLFPMVVEVLQLDNQSVVIPATWSGVQGSECQELGSWLDKWIVAKGFLTGHSSRGRFAPTGLRVVDLCLVLSYSTICCGRDSGGWEPFVICSFLAFKFR